MTYTDDELRIIAMGGHIWIKMLRNREASILGKIYGEFKNGKTEQLTSLAEFATVRDQINEITNAIRQFESKGGQ